MSSCQQPDKGGFLKDYSEALKRIKDMDADKLEILLNDSSEIKSHIISLPRLSILANSREDLMKETMELAKFNLSQQTLLEYNRQNLLKKQQETFKYIEEIKKLRFTRLRTFDDHNVDLLYSLIQISVMEADECSKKTVETCLADESLTDTDISDFTKDYVRSRKLFHLRNIKKEKCEEHLGITSRKKSLAMNRKNSSNVSPRSQSSGSKRRAPLPPSTNLEPISIVPSMSLSPTRKAPPPPRQKSSSPQRLQKNT